MALVEIRHDIIYHVSTTGFLESSGSVSDNFSASGDNEQLTVIPKCDFQPQNPWCGLFGAQQYVEVTYLSVLTVLGVLGNIIVIFSILLEKKLYKSANIFIVNLALADFLAAGVYTPVLIANVIASENALPGIGCHIFGYLIIIACSASMWNLAFIALNRFIAITHSELYQIFFSKTKSYWLVVFTWVWSVALASPTLFGWTNLTYDYKSMVCAWDDTVSLSFSLFLIFGAILIPLVATIFCYWRLFRLYECTMLCCCVSCCVVYAKGRPAETLASVIGEILVKYQRKKSMKILAKTKTRFDKEIKQKTFRQELSLLKTLATALVVFVFCWTPYAFCVLINPATSNPFVKKYSTWLGLNNSAVNFILYGVMNKGYRDGYKKLLTFIFCKR